MKKLTIILLVLLIFSACKYEKKDMAQTEESNTETVVENETTDEWITLFDGSSMDAWRGYLMDSMPSAWSIEDNALAFTPVKGGGQDIITKETFEDFELSLEWKISEGGNSGIFWSVLEDKDSPIYVSALEVQVLDDEKHPDAKNGTSHQAGALYDLVSPSEKVVKPAGEWNSVVIKVNHKTNEGSSSLNGTVIATFPLHGEKWDEMVANSKFKDWETFGKTHNGHIGLQDHGDKVWFRNIKIKKL
ncbi:DUF1080 domain-containing protein [Aureibaculum sp. 2210JD6-5]|uniref:3-keto-disaccharide hydrolase n=1 Tax=Aureibaculum sp. 2210JD6-5 TaxID=3103957 RepID=UPI002AAD931E|nr:DUF1080 domain-containing protein [Aureibaculum sp. 2210JD6-5]MDY7395751.1 DUF1080 domain-containing protein [Aureibaculum sp. 2210JD6-5]